MTGLRIRKTFFIVAAMLFGMQVYGAGNSVQSSEPNSYQDDHIAVSLITENGSLQTGQTHWLGVLFEPIEHWHVYWQNPGDSGFSPQIDWQLPAGVSVGQIQWPKPEFIPTAHLMNYGYQRVLLMAPVTIGGDVIAGQDLTIKAKATWLVCEEACIPGNADLQLTLPVTNSPAGDGAKASEFKTARQQLPVSVALSASYQVANDRLQLVIQLDNADGFKNRIDFFPATPNLVAYDRPPVVTVNGKQITAVFPVSPYATDTAQPFEFVMAGDNAIIRGTALLPKNSVVLFKREGIKMKVKLLSFLFVLLPMVALNANAAPKVGEPAPDFALLNESGKSVSLSDYRGKTVVLEWTNHQCPFVVKHYGSGNMQALQKKYTDKDVVWLSIVSSAPGKQGYVTADQAANMSEQQKAHRSHLLLDAEGQVGKMYAAKTTPHMYVVDGSGVLQYMGAIDSDPSSSPAGIKTATNYVDVVVPQVMAGEKASYATTRPYGCSVKY